MLFLRPPGGLPRAFSRSTQRELLEAVILGALVHSLSKEHLWCARLGSRCCTESPPHGASIPGALFLRQRRAVGHCFLKAGHLLPLLLWTVVRSGPSGAKTNDILNLTRLSRTNTHVQGWASLARGCMRPICARTCASPCSYLVFIHLCVPFFCLHPSLPFALSPDAIIF